MSFSKVALSLRDRKAARWTRFATSGRLDRASRIVFSAFVSRSDRATIKSQPRSVMATLGPQGRFQIRFTRGDDGFLSGVDFIAGERAVGGAEGH